MLKSNTTEQDTKPVKPRRTKSPPPKRKPHPLTGRPSPLKGRPSPIRGQVLEYVPGTILPNGVDARTKEGRRLKLYAHYLAAQVPDSDHPITRARIITCAALLVVSEQLAWAVAQGERINPRDLSGLAYATDMALMRLQGKALNPGRQRKEGWQAQHKAVGPDLIKRVFN